MKTDRCLSFSSKNGLEVPGWSTRLRAANLIMLVQEASKTLRQVRISDHNCRKINLGVGARLLCSRRSPSRLLPCIVELNRKDKDAVAKQWQGADLAAFQP